MTVPYDAMRYAALVSDVIRCRRAYEQAPDPATLQAYVDAQLALSLYELSVAAPKARKRKGVIVAAAIVLLAVALLLMGVI